MFESTQAVRGESLAREVGQSLVLLALTGASVGGFLAIIEVATRALGS